ncbi:Sorting nexin mvp1, variant 2 [Umbelopsis sp. WA50703]
MLEEDDAGNSFYFGSDPPKTLLTPSAPMTASMYASQFDDDDDPWASAITVDPVADMARSLSRQTALNRTNPDRLLDVDEIMANSATASSALAGVHLPPIYETAFAHASPSDGKVSLQALNGVLSLGGTNPYMIDKIIGLVVPRDASYVTKSEFNAAIALLALSQKNVDVSIHSLSRHRNDLPLPIFYGLEDLVIKQPRAGSQPHVTTADEDPWKTVVPVESHSNGLDTSHTYKRQGVDDKPNPVPTQPKEVGPGKSQRTALQPKPAPPPERVQIKKPAVPSPAIEPPSPKSSPSPPSPAPSPSVSRPVVAPSPERPRARGSTDNYQWFLDRDLVKVNVAPEKEGFLFKHTNYVVESQQRSSVVLRRYSDFWWLWETLLKRYPFRILPNLPPKKLGGMDAVFLDKRRKGLTRFVNFLVCHPTLSKDEVVNKFLSEPSELLAWRRQNPPSTDEEFIRLNPDVKDIEPQVPLDLVDRLSKIGGTMNSSIEHYRNLCFTVERMIKRSEAQANDYTRYSDSLRSLSDTSKHCYMENCEECRRVAQGCQAVAEHIQTASNIIDDKVNDITTLVVCVCVCVCVFIILC